MKANNHNTKSRISLQSAIEIAFETNVQEWSNYTALLDRDSSEVKELEKEGYKVVFPAELSTSSIDTMSLEEKQNYEENMRRALILDPNDNCHSLDAVRSIAAHYYSNCPGVITGVDYIENALAIFPCGNFSEDTHKTFYGILTELGYTASLSNGQISVSSEVPYPCVKKSKFSQIFDNVKDKALSVVENIGWLHNTNMPEKNNHSLSI